MVTNFFVSLKKRYIDSGSSAKDIFFCFAMFFATSFWSNEKSVRILELDFFENYAEKITLFLLIVTFFTYLFLCVKNGVKRKISFLIFSAFLCILIISTLDYAVKDFVFANDELEVFYYKILNISKYVFYSPSVEIFPSYSSVLTTTGVIFTFLSFSISYTIKFIKGKKGDKNEKNN